MFTSSGGHLRREQDTKVVQGGGSEEEFQETVQLFQCTEAKHAEISRYIETLTRSSVFTEHLFGGTGTMMQEFELIRYT